MEMEGTAEDVLCICHAVTRILVAQEMTLQFEDLEDISGKKVMDFIKKLIRVSHNRLLVVKKGVSIDSFILNLTRSNLLK